MTVKWTLDPGTYGIKQILDAAEKALVRTLLALEGFIKVTLTGRRHGRVYRRRGKVHVASAPGEPPAIDTGFLRGSVHSRGITERSRTRVVGEVGVGAEYGVYLEKGTRRMASRPFAGRTLKSRENDLYDLFSRLFRGYLG